MPLFLSIDQIFAKPEEFLPLCIHRNVRKSFEKLRSIQWFQGTEEQAKSTAISFKSSGVIGYTAETDTQGSEKTDTKQNNDIRGNTPGITRLLYNRTDSIQQDRPLIKKTDSKQRDRLKTKPQNWLNTQVRVYHSHHLQNAQHSVLKRVLKNLGRYNEFKTQKRHSF